MDYPFTKTAWGIKLFLGLFGCYQKFIKDYRPFTLCMEIDLLTNEPSLQYPFLLTPDVSNFSLGVILSEEPMVSDYSNAYDPRTLDDSGNKYGSIDKNS